MNEDNIIIEEPLVTPEVLADDVLLDAWQALVLAEHRLRLNSLAVEAKVACCGKKVPMASKPIVTNNNNIFIVTKQRNNH